MPTVKVIDLTHKEVGEIELADAEPDWWAPLDVSGWSGKKLNVVAGTGGFGPVVDLAIENLA
jgi:hypothetical protein